jgi:lipopolysaccharide/colanic/teichoic acid biosynthesis glycosyltransferase
VTGITYAVNRRKENLASGRWFDGDRALSPEKKPVNQNNFAEAEGDVAPVSFGQLAMRFTELFAGVACLALLAPILVLIAIAIKFDSRGPILVREARYGYKNRVIQLRKFRAPTVTSKCERSSPRLTRVGQLLRETGIEELPMLINVLAGEMSIIGPPPSAYPTASLNERKPGMTAGREYLASPQNRTPD